MYVLCYYGPYGHVCVPNNAIRTMVMSNIWSDGNFEEIYVFKVLLLTDGYVDIFISVMSDHVL